MHVTCIPGRDTPNTPGIKTFNIENIDMQTVDEEKEGDSPTTEPVEEVQLQSQPTPVLDPPPPSRKSFSEKQQERPSQPTENANEEKEKEQNGERSSRNSSKRSRKTRGESLPPPLPSPSTDRAQKPPPSPPTEPA